VNEPSPTTPEIARLREAGDWIQRLHQPHGQALLDEWTQWCTSDPSNLSAFEQMQRMWNAIPEAMDTASVPPEIATRRRYRQRVIALAASVVLLVGVAGWFAVRHSNTQVLYTAVGEQRRITLADGSQLDLAPDSRVRTRFSLLQRDVRLERGQAFFAVAHGALRPFTVRANNLTVTAVGTAFDVRIDPSSTEVTVCEGRVDVASGKGQAGDHPGIHPEIVQAGVGQRVTFSESAGRPSMATVDPKLAGSWRDGRLQFLGEPLENVVGVVNRYATPRIVVSPAFQQTRFTGTVSPTHVHDWLEALEQIYAVEMVDRGPNGILLRSRVGDGA
jgi:transmembrane sensor